LKIANIDAPTSAIHWPTESVNRWATAMGPALVAAPAVDLGPVKEVELVAVRSVLA
jgi:hypothetical protein